MEVSYVSPKNKLDGKPFTKKLFLHAAKSIDDSKKDFERWVKLYTSHKIQDDEKSEKIESLSSFALTSVSRLSFEINRRILERNKIEHLYIVTESNKEIYPIIVIFTYCCVSITLRYLKEEHIFLSGDEVQETIVRSQFLNPLENEEEEKMSIILRGHELFIELLNNADKNVLDWYDHLSNAIFVYVMSFEGSDKNAEEKSFSLINVLFRKLADVYGLNLVTGDQSSK